MVERNKNHLKKMKEKIRAAMMIEILGKPADYLKQALEEHVNKMEHVVKELKIINKKIAEPKEVKNGIFSTFAEVEIETDYVGLNLATINFMPSHVEIITPEELRLSNFDMNEFFNDLTRKLHQYDEVAKAVGMERDILIKQNMELKEKLGIRNAVNSAVEDSTNIKIPANVELGAKVPKEKGKKNSGTKTKSKKK